METVGPHAHPFIDLIRSYYPARPELQDDFIQILLFYRAGMLPLETVHAHVGELFHSTPGLMEDFRRVLPLPGSREGEKKPSLMAKLRRFWREKVLRYVHKPLICRIVS